MKYECCLFKPIMIMIYDANDPMPSEMPVYLRRTGSVTYTKKFNTIHQPMESLDNNMTELEKDKKNDKLICGLYLAVVCADAKESVTRGSRVMHEKKNDAESIFYCCF